MKEMQMKRSLVWSLVMVFLLMLSNTANAALTTIGTAQFGGTGSAYNLIWYDDNNGNSVVWLDYTQSHNSWQNQVNWAQGLNTTLTYDIDPGYTVDWGTNAWRLPSTVDGPYVYGYDGTTTAGFNITNSEMGHLFYTELGNKGYYDTNGNRQPDRGLKNTGDFEYLTESWYWSGTEYAINPVFKAWIFSTDDGLQYPTNQSSSNSGLAVRSGQVSTAPVPVPGAIWLFGSGILGFIGLRRRMSCDLKFVEFF